VLIAQNADRTALRHLINIVRTGHVAVIFPEGGRTPNGEFQPAQPGIGFVVGKTLCPVVPMRVWGAYEAYPMGGRPRMHPISVRVGPPLRFTKDDFESGDRIDYQRCADRILDAIKALAERIADLERRLAELDGGETEAEGEPAIQPRTGRSSAGG